MKSKDVAEFLDKKAQVNLSVINTLSKSKNIDVLTEILSSLVESIVNGGKLIVAGNGGSFADAQHMSAELVSRLKDNRDPLPSIALGTNASLITAVSNDYSFDDSFSRELSTLGNKTDIVILISTSGSSKNVLKAAQVAIDQKFKVFGLTGSKKGKLVNMIPCIEVDSTITTTIQECHIVIEHTICELLEKELHKIGYLKYH